MASNGIVLNLNKCSTDCLFNLYVSAARGKKSDGGIHDVVVDELLYRARTLELLESLEETAERMTRDASLVDALSARRPHILKQAEFAEQFQRYVRPDAKYSFDQLCDLYKKCAAYSRTISLYQKQNLRFSRLVTKIENALIDSARNPSVASEPSNLISAMGIAREYGDFCFMDKIFRHGISSDYLPTRAYFAYADKRERPFRNMKF